MENQPLGQLIPLSAIYPSNTNPRKRFNEADLKELAESIKQHGVMQPILVRPTNVEAVNNGTEHYFIYEIVAGERRYRASKLAGIEYIPAIARDLNNLETLQLPIIENLQRSDLHPLEEAQGFKALLDNKDAKSWNADQLAEKIGKSRSYIYASLKLCELSTYAQDLFLDDKFGREVALLIARIPGAKLQEQAAKEIINCDFSYRGAKRYIRDKFTLDLIKAPWDKISITLYPAAGSCFSCHKRTGNYPELFQDIESPDVCTDTACFAAKKVAFAQDIIATNPRTIHGKDAKEVAPYGVDMYVTGGYTSNLDNRGIQGHSVDELLGDDLPEPYILIDEQNNTKPVYKIEEVETLMKQKLEEKIASGDIVVQPKQKTEAELAREELSKKQAEEKQRRLHIFNRLAPQISLQHQAVILRMAIDSWSRGTSADLEPIVNLYDFEGSEEEFFIDFQRSDQNLHSLIKMLALLLIAPGIEVSTWQWNSEEDNEKDRDYQDLLSFIGNIGLDVSQFLTAELPLTPLPAAQAQELTADADAPDSTDSEVVDASTADKFIVVDGPKETAAHSEEKPLPPKLQAIKDKELAKRANKAKKQAQKESATADANQ